MFWPFNTKVWFYPKPIDFRKQLNGLITIVADQLKLKPTSGELFVFRNAQANKIKLLYWDRNGFWLCYKRLEDGKLKFPGINDEAMLLTTEQFSWLLSGLDFIKHKLLPEVKADKFY